ncbi:MAG: mannosyltransferase, partial [Chitinophagia bacterium]|nr:mannosyltransferase [Chitinophagia bacterium]
MSPENHLHIVCLDVPYPADYGGACEMYHKVVAMSKAGVHVTLHCYDYGRGRQPELDRWCRAVHYYPRNEGHKGLSLKLPYIVASRAAPGLVENLCADDTPVLFEGLHTTFPLQAGLLSGRRCFVRLHNLEHEYYSMLSRQVPFGMRRFLYAYESRLLRSYERVIADKAVFLTMTEGEAARFRTCVPGADVRCLLAFTGRSRVESLEGEGTFCLYHGNLSVPENENAARWLLKEVFDRLELPFVVAGKRPSASLRRLAHRKNHTCIVEDPSERELEDLVRRAQVHVLPSFSTTGVKFK